VVNEKTLSYGRPDMFHRDAKIKQQYAAKLKHVLRALSCSIREFEWDSELTDHSMYRFSSTFSVTEIDDQHLMANLSTAEGARSLTLSCSLGNFSHVTLQDGKPCFQSTNYGFFTKLQAVRFETVFIITSISRSKLFGSPLYLKLPINKGLSL
jgi:hypothetical protein